jgi:hypothetical protein
MNTNEKWTTYIFLIYFPYILTGEEEYFIIPVREMKKKKEEEKEKRDWKGKEKEEEKKVEK